jgi:hypothetical protein
MKTQRTRIAIFAAIFFVLVPFFATAQSYDPVHGGNLVATMQGRWTLLFGTGVRTHFGSNGGSTGFGAGLDLGIIHNLGTVGPLPELRWGFALTQLGLGYAPQKGRTGSPAPFTPVADVQALLVSSDNVQWSIHTGFSAPSFQNVRYRAGSRVSFFDRITVDLGWDIDAVEQNTGSRDTGSMLPAVAYRSRWAL